MFIARDIMKHMCKVNTLCHNKHVTRMPNADFLILLDTEIMYGLKIL